MKTYPAIRRDVDIQNFLLIVNLINIVIGIALPVLLIFLVIVMPITNLYHFFTNIQHINKGYPSGEFKKYRKAYFWLTVFYVPAAAVLSFWLEGFHDNSFPIFFLIAWIIIPQIVLIAYSVLCNKELKALTKEQATVVLY